MRWRSAKAYAGVLICVVSAAACRARSEPPGAPATRKAAVTDTYHGVQVVDDYRWLEDWNSSEVRAWSDVQNAYARNILDRLESRAAVRARVTELRSEQADSYFRPTWRNGKLFAMKRQPPKQQPFLIVMDSPDGVATAMTLVDPNVLDSTGSTTIDFYQPSLDGKLVAVSLSKGGSESGDVHIYDATGKELYEVVPRVQGGTAGGDLAWNIDGSGFFYTRYPHAGERPPEDLFFYQQVYFHKLGTSPDTDRYELGKDLPKVAEIRVEAHPRRDYLLSSSSMAMAAASSTISARLMGNGSACRRLPTKSPRWSLVLTTISSSSRPRMQNAAESFGCHSEIRGWTRLRPSWRKAST